MIIYERQMQVTGGTWCSRYTCYIKYMIAPNLTQTISIPITYIIRGLTSIIYAVRLLTCIEIVFLKETFFYISLFPAVILSPVITKHCGQCLRPTNPLPTCRPPDPFSCLLSNPDRSSMFCRQPYLTGIPAAALCVWHGKMPHHMTLPASFCKGGPA